MKLPVLPWLVPDHAASGRTLVVQTGSPQLLTRALDKLRQSSPETQFTVLLQKNMRAHVQLREGVEYLDNQGPKPGFVKMLRDRRYDRIYVLFSNEPGYWKLKVLPFLLGPRVIYALNENLDSFAIDLRRTDTLAAHLRWRLESSVTFAGASELAGLWGAAKAVAYPAVLAYLAAYERASSLRAGSAAASWKTENRP